LVFLSSYCFDLNGQIECFSAQDKAPLFLMKAIFIRFKSINANRLEKPRVLAERFKFQAQLRQKPRFQMTM